MEYSVCTCRWAKPLSPPLALLLEDLAPGTEDTTDVRLL
jgi:hypothetical protein